MRIVIVVSTMGLMLGCSLIVLASLNNGPSNTESALVSLFNCERLSNPERREFCEQAARNHYKATRLAAAEPKPGDAPAAEQMPERVIVLSKPETPESITPVQQPNPATERVLAALPKTNSQLATLSPPADEPQTETLSAIETAAGSAAPQPIASNFSADVSIALDLSDPQADLPAVSSGYGLHSIDNLAAGIDEPAPAPIPVAAVQTPPAPTAAMSEDSSSAQEIAESITVPEIRMPEPAPKAPHAEIVAGIRKTAKIAAVAKSDNTPSKSEPEALSQMAPAAGHPPLPTRPAFTEPTTSSLYLIIGSYISAEAAKRQQVAFKAWRAVIVESMVKDVLRYRVVVGPFRQRDFRQARRALEGEGILDAWPLAAAKNPGAVRS